MSTPTRGRKPRGAAKGAASAASSAPTPNDLWHQDPDLIRHFLAARPDYEQLCAEVEYILRKRITAHGIEVSAISFRAKTLDSFLEKLQRKRYERPLDQLTDLAGVRVVCLYRDDITKAADVIRSEFVVVEDIDKLGELGVNEFGYGARHFVVRLGKSSSGARYDDLKQLCCEVQVRSVVQDAWAIIQHHMVYKHESQVPTQLQRKLNSLSGLFETVDDQFERIREERESYISEVRHSSSSRDAFLDHELNFDTFREYLDWAFPGRPLEAWEGQAQMILDGALDAGHRTLRDLDRVVQATKESRAQFFAEVTPDPLTGSCMEVAAAVGLTADDWESVLRFGPKYTPVLARIRGNAASG